MNEQLGWTEIVHSVGVLLGKRTRNVKFNSHIQISYPLSL